MKLSLIAAIDDHRAIGYQGNIPWYLPADMQYFKKNTFGKPVIMGRKTYVSIGHALPGRRNLVVSHQPDLVISDSEVYSSIEGALAACSDVEEVMVIGGSALYHACLPLAQRLYLTYVHANVVADTHFPIWDAYQWTEVFRQDYPADVKNMYPYTFSVLERIEL